MKVNRSELQEALEKVKPGLASKELVEQSTSFAFLGDRVVTYNDEVSVSHPVEGLDVRGAVTADKLYKFLNRLKREEIEIEWEEDQVKIVAGKSTAGLVLEREIKLPIEEVGEIGDWKALPDGILDSLKFCYPCCSRDMSRPAFACVHVNGNRVEATDSFQIVRYELDEPVPIDRFLIPASAVRDLVRYNVKEVAEGYGWIHFRSEDGTVFSSRVFEGDFPDIEGFLSFDGTEVTFPKTILQALKRAEIFSTSDLDTVDLPTVVVSVEESQITVSARDHDGWFEEKVRTKYEGDPARFITGVKFLLNLLDQVSVCVIGEDTVRFNGEDWVHVVATMADSQ